MAHTYIFAKRGTSIVKNARPEELYTPERRPQLAFVGSDCATLRFLIPERSDWGIVNPSPQDGDAPNILEEIYSNIKIEEEL